MINNLLKKRKEVRWNGIATNRGVRLGIKVADPILRAGAVVHAEGPSPT
jgi:hypothetical protein